jgi:N-methylhydantoinase A
VDQVQTAVQPHDGLDLDRTARIYAELQGRASLALAAEGFDVEAQQLQRTADLRYAGQAYEVRVGAPDGPIDDSFAETVAATFHQAHQQLYGYSFAGRADQRLEWVNLRVTGVGPIGRPRLAKLRERADGGVERAQTGRRPVCFDDRGFVETAIYDRVLLLAGDTVIGPAIIEEYGSTVPIHPGFAASVDPFGNLIVARRHADYLSADYLSADHLSADYRSADYLSADHPSDNREPSA